MLLATALALLITGCAQQDVYCSKQTGSSSTKAKSITQHHFFVSRNWAEEKLSMQPKFAAAQKMLKNRTQQTFVNGLLGFYYFRHLYFRWKRVCIAHNNCMSCPSIWQLYLHCSLIYFWVPSSCFCIVISLLRR